jgi:hypothetical protein
MRPWRDYRSDLERRRRCVRLLAIEKIVDVGGGNGALIAAILEQVPRAAGLT